MPTLPSGVPRRNVELPRTSFAAIPKDSVLCDGCIDAVFVSWAADLAANIKSRGLTPEDAALELLQRWGWYEPYTGPQRAEQRAGGPVVLTEAFSEAPAWAMASALGTAAFLYAHFQRQLGRTPPAHRIGIWDRSPTNIIMTETIRLWEIESWDSDSGNVVLWIGEHGGHASGPSSLRQLTVHVGSLHGMRPAIIAASADPLLGGQGRSSGSFADTRHLGSLLRETVEARQAANQL